MMPKQSPKNIFITGATGFVGLQLLKRIDFKEYKHIYCLGRTENSQIREFEKNDNFTFIKADLLKPEIYYSYLKSIDIVIHIAAITGKAKPEEFFDVNYNGTSYLVNQCKRYGVKKFIYISSIAVKFENIKNYYYAQSKIKAEKIIIKSAIPYTIVRPTIIIGKNSTILNNLLTLAKLPIVPIFGDGKAQIQPIFIDDFVHFIIKKIQNNKFNNEIIEIGGPEQISIENFIKKINFASNKKKFRSIYIPVSPLKAVLSILERVILPLLPFTIGQLSSFTNDGITNNKYYSDHYKKMMTVDEMLILSLSQLNNDGKVDDLEKECKVLTNYLVGQQPDDYVIKKYLQGHLISGLEKNYDFFDSFLIKIATTKPFFTMLVDVYTKVFFNKSVIKRKLILLLAILECCESTYFTIDTTNELPNHFLFAKLAQKASFFLLMIFLSILSLGSIQLIYTLHKRFFIPS